MEPKRKRMKESGPEIDPRDIELVKIIGKGSFGEVWQGMLYKTKVAVKIPFLQELNEEKMEEIRKECEVMQSHPHHNICRFMGASLLPNHVRIVTELLDGDIEQLLYSRKDVELSLYQKLLIAKDTVQAMIWLHRMKPPIIHRDLKPANLLYGKGSHGEYIIKVSDFGLSAFKEGLFIVDGKAGAKGTPIYMPPEVMTKQAFNEKVDIYSFGIVLWELIMRKEPFDQHDDYNEFVKAIVGGERPPLDDIPLLSLKTLLCRCWHEDPQKRPDFEEIDDELIPLLAVAAAGLDMAAARVWLTVAEGSRHTLIALIIAELCKGMDTSVASINGAVLTWLLRDELQENGIVGLAHYGKIMQWLGPYSAKETWGMELLLLFQCPWFFGPLTLDGSFQVMNQPQNGNGSFLVRFSSVPGLYTIVRKVEKKVGNVRIQRSKEGYSITQGECFPTLIALIDHVRDDLSLLFPCTGSPIHSMVEGKYPQPVSYA